MIVTLADCPYCDRGRVGFDAHRPRLVFNPDRHLPHPCPHLAAACGELAADRSGPGDDLEADAGRSCLWVWVRDAAPEAFFRPGEAAEHGGLLGYLAALGRGVPATESVPRVPFHAVGGTSAEREEARPGRGQFLLPVPGQPPLYCALYGWAFYSPDPVGFVGALPVAVLPPDRPG